MSVTGFFVVALFRCCQQSRSALTSPTPSITDQRQPHHHYRSALPMKPASGSHKLLADVTVHSSPATAATPPANRRRLFNPKNLRSPFGQRRPAQASTGYTENGASTLSGKHLGPPWASVLGFHCASSVHSSVARQHITITQKPTPRPPMQTPIPPWKRPLTRTRRARRPHRRNPPRRHRPASVDCCAPSAITSSTPFTRRTIGSVRAVTRPVRTPASCRRWSSGRSGRCGRRTTAMWA